jgi:hypothetical protein
MPKGTKRTRRVAPRGKGKCLFFKGTVTYIQERVGDDKKTRDEKSLSLGERVG